MSEDIIINGEKFDEFLDAWDDIHNAAQQIMVAQPHSIGAAAERLEAARKNMVRVVNGITRSNLKPS